VAHSQLLYAAPVWASALVFDSNIRVLQRPQRKIAIRIACAYRTVSTNATLVVAGTFLIHLPAAERCAIYKAKEAGLNLPTKQEMRTDKTRKWQSEWERSETGRWTKTLISHLQPWLSSTFRMVNPPIHPIPDRPLVLWTIPV